MKSREEENMEQGITLVALIITIIVLIILAAVTIYTFRNSKLIEVAMNGTINYANEQSIEESIMVELSDRLDEELEKLDRAQRGKGGQTEGGNEGATDEELKAAVSVIAEKMKIEITTTNKEGIKEFKYKISPEAGGEGRITPGEKAEVITTIEGSYTVTITAIDNEENEREVKTEIVKVTNKLTVAAIKSEINGSNLKEYLGEEVEYAPEAGGTWRVFYYDETGEFGTAKTLYLKRDYNASTTDNVYNHRTYEPTEETLNIMKKMNPLWASSSNSIDTLNENERSSAYFYDQTVWSNYKTEEAGLVMASPSVEMYMKSYNISKGSNNALVCKIENTNGYAVGSNGEYLNNSGYSTASGTIDTLLANGMYGRKSLVGCFTFVTQLKCCAWCEC